jgi:glyoxylase-like metal-dependent hydrolase (beta-lactamase superfamily II)
VQQLVDIAEADGMTVTGVMASHYHADHVGGSMMGHTIEGITTLLEHHDVPIHVNKHEVPWVLKTTGVSESNLVAHESGDVVQVGSLSIECLHTPGHTPGSQCFLTNGCLVSGDTLFLEGCGRTDLPGGDSKTLLAAIRREIFTLPAETRVLTGHGPDTTVGEEKASNPFFTGAEYD